MAKKRKGKSQEPKEDVLQDGERTPEPTMEEHIRELHGDAAQPQSGLPSKEWLKETFQTKSAAVRFLINQGHEIKLIAKHLDMRYQHVRNVATNPLKRGPNEDWRKPMMPGYIPDIKDPNPDKS